MAWYYKQTEPGLWTVGHGEGTSWTTDSDHDSRESAAARVAYLNGQGELDMLRARVAELEAEIVEWKGMYGRLREGYVQP